VLLVKRKNTDSTEESYSFIGGTFDDADSDIVTGLKREKKEEIGSSCYVRIYSDWNLQTIQKKQDGNTSIQPHYLGIFMGGEIKPSKDHLEYIWVDLADLKYFAPKISAIPDIAEKVYQSRGFILRGKEAII
jgi:ADP-ribose pyrophosphatase YjhB (NUDIX family)